MVIWEPISKLTFPWGLGFIPHFPYILSLPNPIHTSQKTFETLGFLPYTFSLVLPMESVALVGRKRHVLFNIPGASRWTFLWARSYSHLTNMETVAQMFITLPKFPQQMNVGATFHIQLCLTPKPSSPHCILSFYSEWSMDRQPSASVGVYYNCRISGLNQACWIGTLTRSPGVSC